MSCQPFSLRAATATCLRSQTVPSALANQCLTTTAWLRSSRCSNTRQYPQSTTETKSTLKASMRHSKKSSRKTSPTQSLPLINSSMTKRLRSSSNLLRARAPEVSKLFWIQSYKVWILWKSKMIVVIRYSTWRHSKGSPMTLSLCCALRSRSKELKMEHFSRI